MRNRTVVQLVLIPAAIFGLAYAVRLLYLCQMQTSPCFNVPLMDAAYHDEWARRIAGGDWIGDEVFFRAPLYPYFLGVLFRLLGHDLVAVRAIQFALGAATCVLIYFLGLRVAGLAVGVIAAFMAACYGPMVFFEGELLLPVLETLLATAMLLCLAWALEVAGMGHGPAGGDTPTPPVVDVPPRPRRTPWYLPWLLTGLCLGLFAITRPNILAFVPVLAVVLVLGLGWRPGTRAAGLCLLTAGLCILPVTVRNYVVGHDLVLIASQAGVNLYIGNNPRADGVTAVVPGTRATWWGGYRDTIDIAERARGRRLRPSEVSAYWSGEALRFVRAHPGEWLRLMGRKLALFWYGYELANNEEMYPATWFSPVLKLLLWHRPWLAFPFGVVAPLGLLGLLLVMVRRQWQLVPAAAFLVTYCATVVAFFVCARYRLPCLPALLVLAAYAAVETVVLARRGRWRAVAGCGAVLVVTGFGVNYDFYGRGTDDLAKAHLDFGLCYQAQGRLPDAERELRQAVALEPTRPEPRLGLALCLTRQQRTREARAVLATVLAADPHRGEALVAMGDALVVEKRDEQALAYYRQAIAQDPRGGEAYARLSACLRRLGRHEEARQALAGGTPGPADEVRQLELARLWFERGDYAQVITLGRQVLSRAPGSTDAAVLTASALANTGQFAAAEPLVRRVLAAHPDNAVAMVVLGKCLLQASRLDEAVAVLEQAVARDPRSADAWSVLGACHAFKRELPQAIAACTTALGLDPANAETRFIRAGCYYDAGRYPEAAQDCRQIITARPDFTPAHELLAEVTKRHAAR